MGRAPQREHRRARRAGVGAVVAAVASLLVALTGTAGASTAPPSGYHVFDALPFGDAGSCGLLGYSGPPDANAPVVGMAVTRDCGGSWVAAADGGVFTAGSAGYFGSAAALPLQAPVVGIAATPDGGGYWLVAADGGVFGFGDAGFFGSAADLRLGAPVVGIAATADGRGYWLVAADGGVFTFGAAGYFGSPAAAIGAPYGSEGGSVIANPVIGLIPSPSGDGYLLVPTTPAVDRAAGRSGYSLAKNEWEIAGLEVAVYQSETWQQAAAYLALGARVDGGDTAGYAAAITELEQLAFIPEMDVTPAQAAEATADVAALDAFFHVPAAASA